MHVCTYIYLVFTCAGVGVQRATHMEVRGQLAGVGFLLPPSGSLLTKVISLGSMYFYPLGHLVSPIFDYFFSTKLLVVSRQSVKTVCFNETRSSLVSLMRNFN